MDKELCLFLGAGASRAFGYPTTVEFLDNLRGVIPHYDFFEHVVDFIANDIKEQPDIEKIIWQLENMKEYIKSGNEEKWFKNTYLLSSGNFKRVEKGQAQNSLKQEFTTLSEIIDNIIDKIKEQVYRKYWEEPDGDYEDYKVLYPKFFELFPDSNFNIFTTNYDTLLDNLFLVSNIYNQDLYSDGFIGDKYSIKFTNNFKDIHKFKVYKIHGSVNWRRDPKDFNSVTKIDHPAFTTLSGHPMLFPGSKYSDDYPFNLLYKRLKEKLGNDGYIIFIGFSFRDEDLNNIFKEALNSNKNLRYVIWNPDKVNPGFDKSRILHFEHNFGVDTLKPFFKVLQRDKIRNMKP